MRGLVQSKPFTRTPRIETASRTGISFSGSKRRGRDQTSPFILIMKKWWVLILISILSLILWIFLLKWTWYNPVYLIENIEYPEETKQDYWNTELFVLSSKFLRWKYYNTLRVWGEWSLLDWVRKEYPFVKDVHIDFLWNQSVRVDFDYYEPEYVVNLWDKKYGIWWNNVSTELNYNRNLWRTAFIIDTPSYLSWVNSLSWFFYEIDYSWYPENIPLIQEAFPDMTRFVYLVWSSNFIVFENGKMIYLYKEDIPHQLQKYKWLKTYYDAFDTLATIDLWSLNHEKVVVGRI